MTERRRHARVSAEQASWRTLRLRTGDVLSVVDLAPGGALVEASRRLFPGTMVVFQVSTPEGTLTRRAMIARCAVHALRGESGVRYRAALSFGDDQERWPDQRQCDAGQTSAIEL